MLPMPCLRYADTTFLPSFLHDVVMPLPTKPKPKKLTVDTVISPPNAAASHLLHTPLAPVSFRHLAISPPHIKVREYNPHFYLEDDDVDHSPSFTSPLLDRAASTIKKCCR